jgi:hypothetical protein
MVDYSRSRVTDTLSATWIPTFRYRALLTLVIDSLRKFQEATSACKAPAGGMVTADAVGRDGGGARARGFKVDERVGSHVDVKDRNCEFVDPRLE